RAPGGPCPSATVEDSAQRRGQRERPTAPGRVDLGGGTTPARGVGRISAARPGWGARERTCSHSRPRHVHHGFPPRPRCSPRDGATAYPPGAHRRGGTVLRVPHGGEADTPPLVRAAPAC